MVMTLQNYLDKKYPTKKQREVIELIVAVPDDYFEGHSYSYQKSVLGNGEGSQRKKQAILPIPRSLNLNWDNLDLSDFPNVDEIELLGMEHGLTSIDFLNTLPSPEKINGIFLYGNNIKPTNIEVFSRFVNLEMLKIGTTEEELKKGKKNNFYGSFKS